MQNEVNLKLNTHVKGKHAMIDFVPPFFTDICLLILFIYLRTFWVEGRFLRKTEFGMSYSCKDK